jgi:hypothetical protein
MTHSTEWYWIGLLLLGAFHGINPGMGWLFAVALGMQERSRTAVWKALLPLGLGHVLAVAAAVILAALAGTVLPLRTLQWVVAGILLAFGVLRMVRHRHPRWVGMRVGARDLTVWSFLMASAHGAGLMVLPIYVGLAASSAHAHMHHSSMQGSGDPMTAILVTLVHTAGYLAVSTAVALVVFEKLGVGLLRKAWLNLDLIWAGSLAATGVATLAW